MRYPAFFVFLLTRTAVAALEGLARGVRRGLRVLRAHLNMTGGAAVGAIVVLAVLDFTRNAFDLVHFFHSLPA